MTIAATRPRPDVREDVRLGRVVGLVTVEAAQGVVDVLEVVGRIRCQRQAAEVGGRVVVVA
jgi:hypothetical protein